MKTCPHCHETKPKSEFSPNRSRPGGLACYCKPCQAEYALQHYRNNKEKFQKRYKDNCEAIKEKSQQWSRDNKEKVREYSKRWKSKNKDKLSSIQASYDKKRRARDPFYKVRTYTRNFISRALAKKGYSKKTKTCEILGCSFEIFLDRLISTAIENYGFYNPDQPYAIDHIVPLATAKTEEEIIKLNHYTNLQYLTPGDNAKKSAQLGWMTEYRRKNLKGEPDVVL